MAFICFLYYFIRFVVHDMIVCNELRDEWTIKLHDMSNNKIRITIKSIAVFYFFLCQCTFF